MDELDGAEQLGRDGDLPPVLGAALQGPDPDRGGLVVDVHRPDGQGLGDPGAGVGENVGERLVGRPRRQARGFEEALALIGGQVLPATGVDELEVADQARHFARRSVYRGGSARPRLGVLEFRKGRDRGLQGVRSGP